MNWYLLGWKRFLDFSGRSRRKEYWTFSLINSLFLIIVFVVYLAFAELIGSTGEITSNDQIGFYVIWTLLTLSCTVRRLHDTGRSGWWILVSFIPFGGLVVFVFTLLDSDPYTNEYGFNPKFPWTPAMATGNAGFPVMRSDEKPQPFPFTGEINFGFCKNCGTKLKDAAPFCSNCGTHV